MPSKEFPSGEPNTFHRLLGSAVGQYNKALTFKWTCVKARGEPTVQVMTSLERCGVGPDFQLLIPSNEFLLDQLRPPFSHGYFHAGVQSVQLSTLLLFQFYNCLKYGTGRTFFHSPLKNHKPVFTHIKNTWEKDPELYHTRNKMFLKVTGI